VGVGVVVLDVCCGCAACAMVVRWGYFGGVVDGVLAVFSRCGWVWLGVAALVRIRKQCCGAPPPVGHI
jgi:hypothetical protein